MRRIARQKSSNFDKIWYRTAYLDDSHMTKYEIFRIQNSGRRHTENSFSHNSAADCSSEILRGDWEAVFRRISAMGQMPAFHGMFFECSLGFGERCLFVSSPIHLFREQ